MSRNPDTSSRSRIVTLVGSIVVLATVIILIVLSSNPGEAQEQERASEPPPRTVTVVTAEAETHAAEIVGLAEARPLWSSTLRAQVSGLLIEVSSKLQPGVRVPEGMPLMVVDPAPFEARLAEAEHVLDEAELELARAQNEADEARQSWNDSGLTGEPGSSLVLHGPQLEAAATRCEAARAARDWAARQLEHTVIRAPFDCVVLSRRVSRGELVQEGEPVAEVYSTDALEVELLLSQEQWLLLPDALVGRPAELVDPGSGQRWGASITRPGRSIDPATRMRSLYLLVDKPLDTDPPLLPGSFVQVHLQGREVAGLLELPESALTPRGQVWYVDDQSKLRSFEAAPALTATGIIYVPEPFPMPAWRVVKHPLESYLSGQVVRPLVEDQAEPGER
jgi:RND family efflux transporter MFP subunit